MRPDQNRPEPALPPTAPESHTDIPLHRTDPSVRNRPRFRVAAATRPGQPSVVWMTPQELLSVGSTRLASGALRLGLASRRTLHDAIRETPSRVSALLARRQLRLGSAASAGSPDVAAPATSIRLGS